MLKIFDLKAFAIGLDGSFSSSYSCEGALAKPPNSLEARGLAYALSEFLENS